MNERLKTYKILNFRNSNLESSNVPTLINIFKLKWSIVFRLAKNISGKLT